MIRVTDDYCIKVDPLNYAVWKDSHKVDKKGVPIMPVIGYLESLPKALEFILKRSATDALCTDDEISLKEAIEIVNAKYDEVIKLILQAVPDVHVSVSNEPVRSRK